MGLGKGKRPEATTPAAQAARAPWSSSSARIAQGGVGGLGQTVGQLLHLAVPRAPGVGGPPVGVHQAPGGEHSRGGVPLLLAPAAVVPQHLGGDRLGTRGQQVSLRTAELAGEERRHVTVAAVLAQRRAGLPGLPQPAGAERGRDDGPERPVRARHGPPRPVAAGHGAPQQRQDRHESRPGLDAAHVAERLRRRDGPHAAQRLGRARRPSNRAPPVPPCPVRSCRRPRSRRRHRRGREGRRGRRSSRTRNRGAPRRATRRGNRGRSR